MENMDNEKFGYWEGIVERVTRRKNRNGTIFGCSFKIGSGNSLTRNEYPMSQGKGFNKKNMPQEGDLVLLKYHKGKGYRCSKEYSKIVKVLKRCGEE